VIYLLDSNAWIGHLRQNVTTRLHQIRPADVVLCSVVLAELWFGAERSDPSRRAANLALISRLRLQFISIPFDDSAAKEYGSIRAHLAAIGQPIGPNDLLIAAIAVANGFALVTHNTAEFRRVPGLVLEDWMIP
jgi:tRNA(fMet)-specific endonuclease VapC